jgi:hypothetical protein
MLSRSSVCRFLFLIIGLVAAMPFWPAVMAQEDSAPSLKLDEFAGLWSSCDYGGRLDSFTIELQNNPDSDGYIICYGPEGLGSLRLDYTKEYLLNGRGLDPARIKTLYGGRYSDLKEVFTELWIVPHGASPPETVSFKSSVKTFNGMFDEFLFWEGPYDGEGIPQEYVTLAGFADVLGQQPESRAYIVVRSTKQATPGAWRRAANDVSARLHSNNISDERIKIICAGYDAETENDFGQAIVQLWVLPKGAPPPIAEVTEPEPRPEKAVEWRSFNPYELTDAKDTASVFEDFADVLRRDKGLSVCIIVYSKDTQDDVELVPDAELSPKALNDEPKVDLMELAGNWKSELAKAFGISDERLILYPATAHGNEMSIWIVPKGGALPDPYEENSVDAEEAGDTQQETPEAEPVEEVP